MGFSWNKARYATLSIIIGAKHPLFCEYDIVITADCNSTSGSYAMTACYKTVQSEIPNTYFSILTKVRSKIQNKKHLISPKLNRSMHIFFSFIELKTFFLHKLNPQTIQSITFSCLHINQMFSIKSRDHSNIDQLINHLESVLSGWSFTKTITQMSKRLICHLDESPPIYKGFWDHYIKFLWFSTHWSDFSNCFHDQISEDSQL